MRLLAMNNRFIPVSIQRFILKFTYSSDAIWLIDGVWKSLSVWLCRMVWRFNTTHFVVFAFVQLVIIHCIALHNRLSLARNHEKWLLACKLFSRFPERTNALCIATRYPVSSEISPQINSNTNEITFTHFSCILNANATQVYEI